MTVTVCGGVCGRHWWRRYVDGNGDPFARVALRVNQDHAAEASVVLEDGMDQHGNFIMIDDPDAPPTYPALPFEPNCGALGVDGATDVVMCVPPLPSPSPRMHLATPAPLH